MTKPSGVHLPNPSPRHRAIPYGKTALPQASTGHSTAGSIPQSSGASTNFAHSAPQPHDFRGGDAQRNPVMVSDDPGRRGHPRGVSRPRYWLAGSSIVAGLMLMVDVGSLRQPQTEAAVCQSVVQADAYLSREHLASLMAIPERDSKATVKQALGEPYCTLSPVEVRAGIPAEREAYPLAFDPDAWLIVLYEGEEYAGYDFKFPND
ncbi:MAG: hypothetical protein ACFB4J_11190 [Elainellaceae cyanobacterium]